MPPRSFCAKVRVVLGDPFDPIGYTSAWVLVFGWIS